MPKIIFWRNFWARQEEGNETKEFQGRQVRKDKAPKIKSKIAIKPNIIFNQSILLPPLIHT